MDWRHFTKQNWIKDLPLFEQKRRFMKLLSEAEESITLQMMAQAQANQAAPVVSLTGAAVGGSDPLDIKMTTLTELITENGDFALRTETSGDNLITDQQF